MHKLLLYLHFIAVVLIAFKDNKFWSIPIPVVGFQYFIIIPLSVDSQNVDIDTGEIFIYKPTKWIDRHLVLLFYTQTTFDQYICPLWIKC